MKTSAFLPTLLFLGACGGKADFPANPPFTGNFVYNPDTGNGMYYDLTFNSDYTFTSITLQFTSEIDVREQVIKGTFLIDDGKVYFHTTSGLCPYSTTDTVATYEYKSPDLTLNGLVYSAEGLPYLTGLNVSLGCFENGGFTVESTTGDAGINSNTGVK